MPHGNTIRYGLALATVLAALGTLGSPARAQDSGAALRIVVNKADNTLRLLQGEEVVALYPVATGKYHCTVEGEFRVSDKRVLAEDGGGGDLGSRWLGLNTQGRRHIKQVGIHGTNDPDSIGGYTSLGCVRLHDADVEKIYDSLPVGTKVTIINDPDRFPSPAATPAQPEPVAATPAPTGPAAAPESGAAAWWRQGGELWSRLAGEARSIGRPGQAGTIAVVGMAVLILGAVAVGRRRRNGRG